MQKSRKTLLMLDQKFCDFLEMRLTDTFRQSDTVSLRGFWCDGVLLPEDEKDLSVLTVNRKRKIILPAFCGFDGQDKYQLLLEFGNKSLSRYTRGLDITECVPDPNQKGWLTLDQDRNILMVTLP